MSDLGAAAGADSAAGAAASAGVRVSIDGGAWLSWSGMPASKVQAMFLGDVLTALSDKYPDDFRGVSIGHCTVYVLLDKKDLRDDASVLTDDSTVESVLGSGSSAKPIFLAVELPTAPGAFSARSCRRTGAYSRACSPLPPPCRAPP